VNLSYHWTTEGGQTVVWDGARTKLPGDVAPGQSVQVQANVTFPTAAGRYFIKWDLVQEGVAWFSSKGVPTRNELVAVQAFAPPRYGASMDVSQTPATMGTRLVYSFNVGIQNTSNFDWGSNVNLSYHWIDASGNAVVWDGLRTSVAGTRQNETRWFVVQVAAPPQPGAYSLRFDVVQEGVAWFGAVHQRAVNVTVPQLGALYTVPSSFSAAINGTATVPVTVTNTGSATWQPGTHNLGYHLYAGNGALFVWDGARTTLAAPVAPGESVTVQANVKAPNAAGTWTVRFDMVQEGVAWFSQQNVPMGSASLQVQ
jgi:hypothetical protein